MKFNELVAGRVMDEGPPRGYEKVGDHWEIEVSGLYEDGTYARTFSIHVWPPDYKGNIAAAWRVVEKMITGAAYECYISHQADGWVCFFTSPGDPEGLAHDAKASFAISLAALRARGVSEDEIQEALSEER